MGGEAGSYVQELCGVPQNQSYQSISFWTSLDGTGNGLPQTVATKLEAYSCQKCNFCSFTILLRWNQWAANHYPSSAVLYSWHSAFQKVVFSWNPSNPEWCITPLHPTLGIVHRHLNHLCADVQSWKPIYCTVPALMLLPEAVWSTVARNPTEDG